jgi:hypothetical protein
LTLFLLLIYYFPYIIVSGRRRHAHVRQSDSAAPR